jgi:hypothetical protein
MCVGAGCVISPVSSQGIPEVQHLYHCATLDDQEDGHKVSVLEEQRRQTMVDVEIETSIRAAIVRSMELGLAVRWRSTGEIDKNSASKERSDGSI